MTTIIFDCFGVLTTDKWKEFVVSLPSEVDKDHLRDLNRQLDAGLLSHEDFKQQVYEASGALPEEVEKTLNNETTKNERLLKFIGEIKAKGVKIGLLSNISSNWITDSFLTSEEQELFDEIILSHKVGITKPDPRIFELACDRLGSEMPNTILVDDSPQNCHVARSLGMQAIVYDDFDDFKNKLTDITGGIL